MGQLAFLGPAGTFGEVAALSFAPEAEHVPLHSHGAVITAIAEGRYERGVVAIENSLDGSVPETLDGLIREPRVFIAAETALPIRHSLIAAEGTSLADIRVIYSHPVALGQCRRFLERELPDIDAEAALSTAAAVQEAVAHPGTAAIGTKRAAHLYGGSILRSDVQDDASNTTRFVLLAREDAERTGDDKTSILFSTADKPGALVDVLQEFARRGINLTKIESRPSKESLGEYVFLVDLEGHRTDELVRQALEGVQPHTQHLRVFGSYRRFRAGQSKNGKRS